MRPDAFPSTQRTWLNAALGPGGEGRRDVNHHIMAVYARPLRVYFLGTAARWLGEPDEIVAGFFADRLARAGFLDDWRRSGLRLRRWLMNAFSFYLSELQRQRRRDRRTAASIPDNANSPSVPERCVDRAFGESVVAAALGEAQGICEQKGLSAHWGMFIRHAYDGLAYERIAPEFGVRADRAAVMARTAARHFRKCLRELLRTDGAPESDMDDEIRALMEALQP